MSNGEPNDHYEFKTEKGLMTEDGMITGDILLYVHEDDDDAIIAKYQGSEDAMVVDNNYYDNKYSLENIEEFVEFLKQPSGGPQPAHKS